MEKMYNMQIEIGSKVTVLSYNYDGNDNEVEVFVFWHGAEHRLIELMDDMAESGSAEDWKRRQVNDDYLIVKNDKINASIVLRRQELQIYGG